MFKSKGRIRIKEKNPTTKELFNFDKAILEGNCCWKLWDDYLGGEAFYLSSSGTFSPGWRIAAVELVQKCDSE